MNELQIQITQQGTITTNLDALKVELQEIAERYAGIVVSEDDIALAKKDLAELRKIREEVESRRKSVKKEWAKPYEQFEAEVKDALKIIDAPIIAIDKQIKDYAEKEKAQKKEKVKELYEQEIGDYREFLPLESIFDEKWLNKSVSEKDILFDLNSRKTQVITDLDSIRALGSEFEDEVIKAYKVSGNQLSAAIKRNSDLISAKQMAEQRAKEEAERKAEAEQKKEERRNEVADLPFPEDDLPFEEEATFTVRGAENIGKAVKALETAGVEFTYWRA